MSVATAQSAAITLLVEGLDARKNGSGWKARCPLHDDRNPSLSINEGNDGRPLVHCFVCDQAALITELRRRGLWPGAEQPIERRNGHDARPRVTLHLYPDAEGKLQAKHKRIDHPDG